jgi:hypothetical protein
MAMPLQEIVVALVALGAAVVVVRRVAGFARHETSPKCANCASGPGCEASTAVGGPASGAASNTTHPLVFVRHERS